MTDTQKILVKSAALMFLADPFNLALCQLAALSGAAESTSEAAERACEGSHNEHPLVTTPEGLQEGAGNLVRDMIGIAH